MAVLLVPSRVDLDTFRPLVKDHFKRRPEGGGVTALWNMSEYGRKFSRARPVAARSSVSAWTEERGQG